MRSKFGVDSSTELSCALLAPIGICRDANVVRDTKKSREIKKRYDYTCRSHGAFKKTVAELAWHSFAWFAAELEHIIVLHNGTTSPLPLDQLLRRV